MGLISAKCTNCGKVIQLDSSMESGFCLYCGAKVLVKVTKVYVGAAEVRNATPIDKQLEILKQHFEERNVSNSIDDGSYWHSNAKKAASIIQKMQELAPTHSYYFLWRSIFVLSPIGDGISYEPYASLCSYPENVCRKRIERSEKRKGLFSKEVTGKVYYEPLTYDEWRAKHVLNLSDITRYISRFLQTGEKECYAVINQFAYWFVKFSMNFKSREGTSIGFCIKNGKVIFDGITYVAPTSSYDSAMRFRNGPSDDDGLDYRINLYRSDHRSNSSFCIADNIIEYFIPMLEEKIKSPNVKVLQDAILKECKKYPNSYYQ